MSISTFPQKGEIWYIKIPNQPEDPHQPRPAVVVSRDARNKFAPDIMLVPIFSEANAYNDAYVIIPANEAGIPHQSVAKCDQLTTVSKALLRKGPLGARLSAPIMWKIHYAVRRALGETRVP